MKFKVRSVWSFARETLAEFSTDKVPRLAAALSYYTLFSIAPLAIIAIAVASVVVGEEAATGALLAQIEGLIGRTGAEAIRTMIDNARKTPTGWLATIMGLVTLAFGATGAFVELQDSLNTIWNVAAKPGKGLLTTVRRRILSFAMVLGIGFLLLVSLVISAGIAAFGTFAGGLLPRSEVLLQIVTSLLSWGVFTVLFTLILKFLPDVRVGWRNLWIGGAFTALLFSLGKLGIGIYLGKTSLSSAFGAAGSIVIVIVWIYYSSLILFVGAEFTQVLVRWREGNPPPSESAVRREVDRRVERGD